MTREELKDAIKETMIQEGFFDNLMVTINKMGMKGANKAVGRDSKYANMDHKIEKKVTGSAMDALFALLNTDSGKKAAKDMYVNTVNSDIKKKASDLTFLVESREMISDYMDEIIDKLVNSSDDISKVRKNAKKIKGFGEDFMYCSTKSQLESVASKYKNKL